MNLHSDPEWPRASEWLAAGVAGQSRQVGVVGLPSRRGSITPGRCDFAPSEIRGSLVKFSTFDLTNGVDIRTIGIHDYGDIPIADLRIEDAFDVSFDAVNKALAENEKVVILGGDNAITRPGARALGSDLSRVGVVTLDAHLDLRTLDNGLTNGNPIRALLADGLPGRNIAQIGIQAFANSAAYHQVAMDNGIRVVSMERVHEQGLLSVLEQEVNRIAEHVDAIYFDLDLDVMDRLFAKGTPGSRPGGLAPYQIVLAARFMGSHSKVKAMDLVELDPDLDEGGATALTAGMAMLAFVSGMASQI